MSSDQRIPTDRPAPAASRRDHHGRLGRRGEELACERLTSTGLQVVARNWRCRAGEIDVIAAGPGLLVFCEVKTRRGHGYGTPAEAVTHAKRVRLRQLAAAYLASEQHPPCTVRFDVVTVTWPSGGSPVIDHLEAAF